VGVVCVWARVKPLVRLRAERLKAEKAEEFKK
jgi:hypothetical protein